MSSRGFPTPWLVTEKPEGFCVEAADGMIVAWTYFSGDASVREVAGAMTREEAQRIARAIAMIPEMRTIIARIQNGLTDTENGEG